MTGVALSRKLRPTELGPWIDDVVRGVDREWITGALTGTIIALGLTAGTMGAFADGDGALFVFMIPILIVGGALGFVAILTGHSYYQRIRTKVTFARELLHALRDDLHPARHARIMLDTGDYDTQGKLYWSGKSPHGNAKHKYEDRWLDLRFVLADGTRVRLVRKGDVKTKKDSVQRHKRRLIATIEPSPERYGAGPWDVSVLDGLVKIAVAEQFHDPPEELRIHAAGSGGRIRLRVTQLDAEILPDEVITVIDATLSAVRLHRPAAGSALHGLDS